MSQSDKITPLIEDLAKLEKKHQVACQDCTLYRLCLPLGLHRDDLVLLDKVVKRRQSYKRKQDLFTTHDNFSALYVVRSGSFKTTISAKNGREQVTGFYFPGEFIGLDAIHMPSYQSSAVALESSSVCALPFDSLQEIGENLPRLQIQLLTRLSKELAGDKSFMLLLGKKTAEEKLATYLLSLSKRFNERGFSAKEFQLTMSRSDIANHLGLAVETISRVFSKLQDRGLIVTNGKSISLIDIAKIEQLCG
jgi:CRP/FNR family transcriptional regulator